MTFRHHTITPDKVHETLAKHMLVDGFSVVVDLARSQGSWLWDGVSGKEYLDFFSFFASNPLGFNHPALHERENVNRLLKAARVKVSNSDKYTTYLAEFVDTLERTAGVPELPYYFFIEGGALAVENAMKVAFDWKAKRNGWTDREANKLQIMHFTHAFHGRSGYTLSVTNTDPVKTNLFPKFDWARIESPYLRFPLSDYNLETTINLEKCALQQMEYVFKTAENTVAAILIEGVVQCEGGNNHFRPEFFAELRRLADQYDALLIFDEIQSGIGITGRWWGYEHHGVKPDIICFGKKMQLGGIMVSNRIDNVEDHCFKKPSRINSTWGGNLVDMVRATVILETIVNDNLLENAAKRGDQLLSNLETLQNDMPKLVSNARGKGLLCAIDLPDTETRNKVVQNCFNNGMIILPCGNRAVRFLPALTISIDCVEKGIHILNKVIQSL